MNRAANQKRYLIRKSDQGAAVFEDIEKNAYDEGKHSRDAHGRFSSSGGGGGDTALGKTSSGKMVLGSGKNSHEYSPKDHMDAAVMHAKAAKSALASGDAKAASAHQGHALNHLEQSSGAPHTDQATAPKPSPTTPKPQAAPKEPKEPAKPKQRVLDYTDSGKKVLVSGKNTKDFSKKDHLEAARLHQKASVKADKEGDHDKADKHYDIASKHRDTAAGMKDDKPAKGSGKAPKGDYASERAAGMEAANAGDHEKAQAHFERADAHAQATHGDKASDAKAQKEHDKAVGYHTQAMEYHAKQAIKAGNRDDHGAAKEHMDEAQHHMDELSTLKDKQPKPAMHRGDTDSGVEVSTGPKGGGKATLAGTGTSREELMARISRGPAPGSTKAGPLGTTKSGKYISADGTGTKGYSKQDHRDAAKAHLDAAKQAESKSALSGGLQGMQHRDIADGHKRQALQASSAEGAQASPKAETLGRTASGKPIHADGAATPKYTSRDHEDAAAAHFKAARNTDNTKAGKAEASAHTAMGRSHLKAAGIKTDIDHGPGAKGSRMRKSAEDIDQLNAAWIAKSDDEKAEAVRERLMSTPQALLDAIEGVFKAEGTEGALDEEAQAAMKAAGRILAPHKDRIPPAMVQELVSAIGLDGTDGTDPDYLDPPPDLSDDEDEDDDDDNVDLDDEQESLNKSDDEDDEEEDDMADDEGEEPIDKDDDEDEEEDDEDEDEEAVEKDDEEDEDDEDDEDEEEPIDKDDDEEDEDDDEDEEGPQKGLPPWLAGKKGGKKMARLAKAHQAYVSERARLGYPVEADPTQAAYPTDTENHVAKSASLDLTGFSAAQRAALTPILKSQAAQSRRQKELEEQHRAAIRKSAALQDKLDRKEFVAKAAEFPHLGTPDELGEKMHNLHKMDPEAYEQWVDVLKSANMAADESPLFREVGSRLSKSANAADKIQQAVEGIVAKSGDMSREQASRAFLETPEGRKLYTQSRHEAEIAKRSI